jgi:hypothetical protein
LKPADKAAQSVDETLVFIRVKALNIWRILIMILRKRSAFKHHETTGQMKISFYYLPIAKQVNAEMKKNLEAEPPEPFIPVLPFGDYDGPGPMIELMRF